ncbi:hypothetical protein DY000_02047286 [Brassica cretica]|uniref:DUF7751 domain-containing protein n=1 Tax=Brassica cretica TaxID=69181 RepID=A0ABQ7EWR0_BRACR|nr:hypothetical protein DY000_02047286 [Brassica cretica]
MLVVAAGANPVLITRGIEKTAKALVAELKKMSMVVEDSELADVAAVSAGNNADIGSMISEAMIRVGRNGVVTLEEGVEKVVGWAFSYHLMSCSEPTIRDNKLIISVESLQRRSLSDELERFMLLKTSSYHHSLSLAPKSISKHSVYSTTIAGSRYELSNQMEVGLDSFQRQVTKRFIDLNSGEARLLQAHKPWNWRSRRQSKTRKELVTSTAAKPWTHQLVSSILRSLPRFFFNSPLSIGRQTGFRHRGGIEIELYIKIGMGGSDVNDVKTLYYNVLGNGLTSSAADVAVYADLHSSVPGLGKVKTAMMLRRRFLGKLPKPGYCKKWITSVDCLMNCCSCHRKLASFFMGVKGENIKPEDIRMLVEIVVYRFLPTPARDVEVKRAMEDDGGLRSLRLVHEVLFALLLTRTSIPLVAVADDSIEVNSGD